jgi:alkylation response protein AidB-like acyl-CoA dehydrogenase
MDGSVKRHVFDTEHEEFRHSVRAFVDRELAPNAANHRAEKGFGRDPWLQAGKQGFLGFMMPERFGGADQSDFRFNAILGEELALLGYGYASAFGLNVDVVSSYLRDLTTESQKERWLPSFCSGEMVTAIAMTEPATGSDLAGISTTATKKNRGWLVNGSKTFITNGAVADLVIVAVKTDPAARSRGISLLVVESGTEGFERGKRLDKVGQPEVDAVELFFADVFVPDENVLGQVGKGFGYMMRGLAQERLSVAVAAVADTFAVFSTTVEYAKDRRAFGHAIGAFQHNRFQLATMATEIDVTRSWVDACLMAHVHGDLSPADAAKAKYWATEVQNRVIDGCVQIFGGYGYMREQRVARAWMDARVTRIYAGTNEIMREVIGRDLGF